MKLPRRTPDLRALGNCGESRAEQHRAASAADVPAEGRANPRCSAMNSRRSRRRRPRQAIISSGHWRTADAQRQVCSGGGSAKFRLARRKLRRGDAADRISGNTSHQNPHASAHGISTNDRLRAWQVSAHRRRPIPSADRDESSAKPLLQTNGDRYSGRRQHAGLEPRSKSSPKTIEIRDDEALRSRRRPAVVEHHSLRGRRPADHVIDSRARCISSGIPRRQQQPSLTNCR